MYRNKEAGLTLIEVALVMLVIGLFMVPLLTIYKLDRAYEIKERSDERLYVIRDTLQRYAMRYGRYPRPAHPNLGPADSGFGQEVADGSITTGCSVDNAGVCFIENVPETGAEMPDDVFVGALPIAELGLPINFIADGFGGKFRYAVTQAQTERERFVVTGAYDIDLFEGSGAVILIDDTIDPDALPAGTDRETAISEGRLRESAHFAVFSAGENGAGAFSLEGNLIQPCDMAQGRDAINCDHRNDVFTDNTGDPGALVAGVPGPYQVRQAGSTYYDDFATYSFSVDREIWSIALNDTVSDLNLDIFSQTTGNVRMGYSPFVPNLLVPRMARLEIHGNLLMTNLVDSGTGLETVQAPKLHMARLCPPKQDDGAEGALKVSDPQFAYLGFDLDNENSDLFVVADAAGDVFWPQRTSFGMIERDASGEIILGDAINIDDECPVPNNGDLSVALGDMPIGVFNSHVIAGEAQEPGEDGEGILCAEDEVLTGWAEVDELCQRIEYSGADIGLCDEPGQYPSKIVGGQLVCE